MNDKFKELMQKTSPRKVIADLIQEATGYTMQVYEVNGVRTFGERVEVFNKEKFAELIVKECIGQIADVRIEHDFDPAVDEVLVQALTGIKKHFGVEL